jgi:hypothetical protein
MTARTSEKHRSRSKPLRRPIALVGHDATALAPERIHDDDERGLGELRHLLQQIRRRPEDGWHDHEARDGARIVGPLYLDGDGAPFHLDGFASRVHGEPE